MTLESFRNYAPVFSISAHSFFANRRRHCTFCTNTFLLCSMSDNGCAAVVAVSTERSEDISAGSSTDILVDGQRIGIGDGVEEDALSGKSNLLRKIEELRNSQKQLRQDRKRCAMEMRNAMRKKKRLQSRAGMLSDTDLLELLRMRQDKKKESEE